MSVAGQLRDDFEALVAHLHAHVRTWIPRTVDAAARDLGDGHKVLLIAIGKAARPMAEVALAAMPEKRVRGLLVPPEGDDAPLPPLEVLPGGHPLPTEGSFAAARRALELCRAAGPDEHVAFLLSGGGSAMFELPIDPSIPLAEWRTFYRALLGCGAAIDRVNAVRMRLSSVKGGRLAVAAERAHTQTTLVVSDVPGDSGLVASAPTDITVCYDVPETLRADLDALGVGDALPDALRARVARGDVPPLPEPSDELCRRCNQVTLLDEHLARCFAAARVEERGCSFDDEVDVDDWPYERAAEALLARLDALRRAHPGRAVAVVTTGELSVPLPHDPGVGGRNQQFALACAMRIQGRPITVMSCGTDGIDGNSPAAGAIVDGTTVARAAARGFDAARQLAEFDAFPLLDAIGDAVVVGPTGTNVRDLRVLVHDA